MNKPIYTLFTFFLSWCIAFNVYAAEDESDTSPNLLLEHGQPALLMNSAIHGKVNGLVVSMTLTQEFKNTSKDWVNGRYVFPMPNEAVIDSLTLRNEDRVLKGVVKEKQEAKQQFEQAKAAGKKAGLLEQNRPNLFAMSMANIAPQSSVKAVITWVQPVDYEGGVFSLSLPTTLTPRYIPGETLQLSLEELEEIQSTSSTHIQHGWALNTNQVPDASDITPPQVSSMNRVDTHQISMDIELNPGLDLDKISSSSHAITVSQQGESHLIQFQNKLEAMDRDVLLQWKAAAHNLPQAAVFTEQKNDAFYHLVMINPPVKNIVTTLAKDVTFIIDTSGSMAGGSMQQAQKGLVEALNHLSVKDRFNIIEFDSNATQLYRDSKPVDASSISEAKQFIDGLRADGGTEMMSALKLAFNQDQHEEYLRQIIFITDGAVGNEKALFSYINQHLGKARLFTVGIGSAPNNHFMQGAAKYGRGTSTRISNLSEVSAKMTRLFEKLTYPVMRDIQVSWPAGSTVESYPANLPDLYVSEPLMFIARSDQAIDKVTLSGQIADQVWQQELIINSADAKADNINKMWAMDKVNHYIEQATLFAEPLSKYKNDIVKLGIDNQIVTKFTSFLAVEDTISRPETELATDKHVANLLPHGTPVRSPNTATPATLQLLLGGLLLLISFVYMALRQRRVKHGFTA